MIYKITEDEYGDPCPPPLVAPHPWTVNTEEEEAAIVAYTLHITGRECWMFAN